MTNSATDPEVMQPSKRKSLLRWLGFAVLVIAGLAAIAPYVPADVLRPHIERALERSLNRKVAVQNVRFTFFPSGPVPGPGFALENVTIEEDPRAGIEPFAHMEELGASVRLLSLLQGRLELSGINLGDASINVVQTATGAWNFQYLLSQTDPGSITIPAIRMRSGRVNFKFGDTKSVFYFNDADLDIVPPSSGSSYATGMEIRFGGAPARTDHSARDFGRFFVSGTASESYRKLDLRVELEKSSLEETLRLIDPRGFGVHGVVAMDAHLSGEPGDLKALGALQIGDVHRWDLLPTEGGVWKVPFAGTLDLQKERLNLLSTSTQAIQPVSVRVHAQNFLKNPDWGASIDFTKVPLAMLFEVANHMGALSPEILKLVASDAASIPPPVKEKGGTVAPEPASTESLKMQGSVTGSLIYARNTELSGKFKLEDISLPSHDGEPVRVSAAVIEMGGGNLQLLPAEVQFGSNQTAQLEGNSTLATPRTLDLKVSTQGLSVDAIRSLGLPALPFLEPALAQPSPESAASDEKTPVIHGTWKGWARYSIRDVLAEAGPDLPSNSSGGSAATDDPAQRSDANASDQINTGTWTSEAELQNASFAIAGLSDPVQIQYAAIKMDGSRIALSRIRAKAGRVSFTGSYQWSVAAVGDSSDQSERPQRFNLSIQTADIADLEQLFGPSLARGRGGLLARTLRLGGAPPAPDWLKSRHAEGNIAIENLTADEWTLYGVKARVGWNGMVTHVTGLSANLDPAALVGDLDIDVSAGSPRYHFTGTLNSVPYHGGVLDLSGIIDSFGAGKQLLLNATASGTAQGRSVAFAPDAEFRTVSANVQLKAGGAGPRWSLSNVEVLPLTNTTTALGSTPMTGSGTSQEDGRLALELTQGNKQVRYVGALFAASALSK